MKFKLRSMGEAGVNKKIFCINATLMMNNINILIIYLCQKVFD